MSETAPHRERAVHPSDRRAFLRWSAALAPAGFLAVRPDRIGPSPAPPEFLDQFLSAWDRASTYTREVAEAMPGADFDFRPVAPVMSFKEHLLRIASTNYGFAGLIRGEPIPNVPDTDPEEKTKDVVVDLLDRSFNAARDVIRQITADQLRDTVPWTRRLGASPTRHPKWGVATTMWNHVAHHRGSLVVYLRLRGIEPPGYVD